MPGRERRDADDVDVLLDRLAGRLLRRCEERADLHPETEIGEGRGDDLLAAVVAVLAYLGDQDRRRAAFVPLKLRGHRGDPPDRLVRGVDGALVGAGRDVRLRSVTPEGALKC